MPAPRNAQQLLHIGTIEVGYAPGANAARLTQAFEARDRFRERDIAAPVQQIQVEVTGRQSLETARACRNDATLRRVLRVDLAHKKHLVAPAGDGFADNLLR